MDLQRVFEIGSFSIPQWLVPYNECGEPLTPPRRGVSSLLTSLIECELHVAKKAGTTA